MGDQKKSGTRIFITKYLGGYQVYFSGLLLAVASLSLSEFTLSVSMFILVINWILSMGIKNKFRLLWTQKAVLVFLMLYLLYIAGLLWTDDFGYAFKSLKVKLPLLLLPVVISTHYKLSARHIKILLLIFSLGVLIGAIFNTLVFFRLFGFNYQNIREISIFISHIHFSVFLCFSILILIYYALSGNDKLFRNESILFFIVAFLQFLFLFLVSKAMTGVITFLITGTIALFISSFKIKNLYNRLLFWIALSVFPVIFLINVSSVLSGFFNIEYVDEQSLEHFTVNGNRYQHFVENREVENGHFTNLYLCEPELRREWNKRSYLKYDSLNDKNEAVKHVIRRYMTSMGLRKDSVGVSRLSDEDIRMIEWGYANHLYKNKYSLKPRIYTIVWQMYRYFNGIDPMGMSVAQRFECYRISFELIREHFWSGVGTGDFMREFEKKYIEKYGFFDPQLHIKGANQFLSFFILFGVFGFIMVLSALVYPLWVMKKNLDYLFIIFSIILFLSFFSESVLFFQTGVSFMAIFYTVFLFGRDKSETKQ